MKAMKRYIHMPIFMVTDCFVISDKSINKYNHTKATSIYIQKFQIDARTSKQITRQNLKAYIFVLNIENKVRPKYNFQNIFNVQITILLLKLYKINRNLLNILCTQLKLSKAKDSLYLTEGIYNWLTRHGGSIQIRSNLTRNI